MSSLLYRPWSLETSSCIVGAAGRSSPSWIRTAYRRPPGPNNPPECRRTYRFSAPARKRRWSGSAGRYPRRRGLAARRGSFYALHRSPAGWECLPSVRPTPRGRVCSRCGCGGTGGCGWSGRTGCPPCHDGRGPEFRFYGYRIAITIFELSYQ